MMTTVPRRTTKGDMERRLARLVPPGYSFVSFSYKKCKAKYV